MIPNIVWANSYPVTRYDSEKPSVSAYVGV